MGLALLIMTNIFSSNILKFKLYICILVLQQLIEYTSKIFTYLNNFSTLFRIIKLF